MIRGRMIRLCAGLVVALLALAPTTATARELHLDGPLIQGGLVLGKAEPGAEVRFEGDRLRVSPEGLFLVGFGRDDEGPFELVVRHPDGSVTRESLAIEKRAYQVQRIDGLPAAMVTPGAEALARMRRENAMIAAVRARDTPEALFAGGFV